MVSGEPDLFEFVDSVPNPWITQPPYPVEFGAVLVDRYRMAGIGDSGRQFQVMEPHAEFGPVPGLTGAVPRQGTWRLQVLAGIPDGCEDGSRASKKSQPHKERGRGEERKRPGNGHQREGQQGSEHGDGL